MRFNIIQSMSLGQQRHIYSIEMNNKILLIGSTPNHINLIKEFDKKTFDQEYFNDNSKPYLIITGAKPIEYSYGIKKFKNMIEQVVTKYGKDYNIVFKPHPAALPDETYTKYFNDLGIKILPGRMPMEVISFTYPNLYYGGFASSLYMSVPENSALFFFAQKSNDLFVPLDTLAGTIFKEASYIQPK